MRIRELWHIKIRARVLIHLMPPVIIVGCYLIIIVNKKAVSTAFFVLCAEHGTSLTGESPVTGIYRQV